MSRLSSCSLAMCLVVLLCSAAGSTTQWTVTDNDWSVIPDPPSNDQDITVVYRGDDEWVEYEIDGEKPVRVDVTESGRFVIPRKALVGKAGLSLQASGGERGFRVIRFR
ncbi:MAG: hypothetical protein H6832_02545 [Planctomycetes bacterium]|nr:hypothetical protein [Planctomycetota bacterium]MCB9917264.1 hypothetical protein [Planctomycetota bacterium]